jgi:uncharacterized protein
MEWGIKEMSVLYPSWIEIPAADLERALAFYRAVFGLTETPARIAVLLASDKTKRNPGVSLVQSPLHTPCHGGPQVNFHMDAHAALTHALSFATTHGGCVLQPIVDMGDGVRYAVLCDCEGNTFAVSSHEPLDIDNSSGDSDVKDE